MCGWEKSKSPFSLWNKHLSWSNLIIQRWTSAAQAHVSDSSADYWNEKTSCGETDPQTLVLRSNLTLALCTVNTAQTSLTCCLCPEGLLQQHPLFVLFTKIEAVFIVTWFLWHQVHINESFSAKTFMTNFKGGQCFPVYRNRSIY